MHREIYRAIRARDPIEARRLLEKHLRMAQAAQGLERPTERKAAKLSPKPEILSPDSEATSS